MKKSELVIGIIIGLILLTTALIISISQEKTTEVVECYDEYNNEIIGLDCISERGQYDIVAGLLAIGGFIIMFFSMLMLPVAD